MNCIKKTSLFALIAITSTSLFTSCVCHTDSKVNENTDHPETIYGKVISAAGAKMLTPIVQRGDRNAAGHILFEMEQPAETATTITFQIDPEVLRAYNKLNGTSFAMYPADKLSFENNGTVIIDAGKKKSESIQLDIRPNGTIGTTYAVAISATAADNAGKHENNQAYIYLVKPSAAVPAINADRKIKNLCYVEVNRESMLNVGEYTMKEDKTPFFDIASVFAANIRLNDEDRPYVSCNEQTRYVLDNIEKTVRPLQEKGIKVNLSILGDHTAAGMRSLSRESARIFAKDLKAYMDIYGFDGIDFDDEYSTYATDQKIEPYIASPAVAPGIEACTQQRYADLIFECRRLMPDKAMGIYWYTGYDYPAGTTEGKTTDEMIDYAIYGFYRKWKTIPADTVSIAKQCPYAIDLTLSRGKVEIDNNLLKEIKENGWGYFAIYDLNNERSYEKEFSEISKTLYNEEVVWSGKSYDRTEFIP